MLNGHSISAFVITCDEEENIADCLRTLRWVDELVVVDSFSDDDTVEIARRAADRVVRQEFLGYRDQTRFAFEQTTGDWVVWLDADERLTAEARESIKAEFDRPAGPTRDGYAFPRRTWFVDRWIKHSGWYPQPRVRMFRREKTEIRGGAAHPRAKVDGEVKRLAGDILHFSYPEGLSGMVRRSARFARIGAEERYREARRFSLPRLVFRPPLEFLKKYLLQLGVLDGMPGFLIAVGSAYYRFVREATMWELDHAGEPDAPDP